MKFIILSVCALLAVVIAQSPAEPPKILRSDYQQSPDGGFFSSFETEDGTIREEVGEVKEVLNEEGDLVRVLVIRGSYSYLSEEGIRQTITYIADEAGYRAEGDAIPKEPVARR